MTTLLHKLSRFQPFTAMVVGDYMVDQHLYGAAERLSADAPVPVLHQSRQDERGGGAANVASCLRALQAEVLCFGVLGRDAEGLALRRLLADAGCDVEGLIDDPSRPTTVKRSFIGLAQHRHPQKMFRVDVESRGPVTGAVFDALLAAIEARAEEADVICLEDYNKGVCSEALCAAVIAIGRRLGKPILVDPAAITDYGRYRRATAITPNRSEAELATGVDTPIDASELHNTELAARLREDLDLDAVILTLDRHGALLQERDRDPLLVPTVARSVYDVTGAGDVVLAALAGACANNFTWPQAVRFANAAAGLEVEVFGAQPIPLARVQREILAAGRTDDGKVRDEAELLIEIAVHREAGDRIVFTNGCFDLIHAGHITYLREARQQGDLLIVAVNSDAQVCEQKGEGRPIFPIEDRLAVLSELQSVDYLTVFEDPTADRLLRAIRPDVYVKGGDYAPDEINEQSTVRELGLELRILAHRPGLGSTEAIERIRR